MCHFFQHYLRTTPCVVHALAIPYEVVHSKLVILNFQNLVTYRFHFLGVMKHSVLSLELEII